MAITLAQLAYGAYKNRDTFKRVLKWAAILIGIIALVIYIIVASVIAVIQGNGRVSDNARENALEFSEFTSFSYKTINGEVWYDFVHPYFFPTLGALTQGAILDSSAKVGTKHIAWDIADRVSRSTEVKAFADGTVVAVNDNILYNTTRRWKFCDSNPSGICWYQVTEKADVQYGCGYEVIILHADSLSTQYCHLASAPGLQVGDTVNGGQDIGYQGSTGWATGKHLHFALWRGGQPIDPSYAFTQTSLSDWSEQ